MNDDLRMMIEWDSIIAQPLSDEVRQQACLAALRTWMAHKAAARFGQPNPPLRFYADMLVLQRLISFSLAGMPECQTRVLRPSVNLVWDWVRQHSELHAQA
jgi:hypothetical protein